MEAISNSSDWARRASIKVLIGVLTPFRVLDELVKSFSTTALSWLGMFGFWALALFVAWELYAIGEALVKHFHEIAQLLDAQATAGAAAALLLALLKVFALYVRKIRTRIEDVIARLQGKRRHVRTEFVDM